MGTASRVVSVFFRIMELISATIVAGLLGTYLHYINDAHVGKNGRVIYSIVIAGISIFFSLVLTPPFRYSFYAFPFDFAMFVCWIVAFGLLVNLVGTGGCHSYWYTTSWGWAWGRWYRVVPASAVTSDIVGTSACSKWRTSEAFAFIGGFFWLLSFFLGLYVLSEDRHHDHHEVNTEVKRHEDTHMASGVTETQAPAAGAPSQQDVPCTQCGTLGRVGNKFCNNCGAQRQAGETV